MSTFDVVGTALVVGGALAMAAVTGGPAYFLFEVLPKMCEEAERRARKEHFIRQRRARRKERMKQSKEQVSRICLAS